MKYKINPQIGRSKHSVSFHDGVKTHKDGSEFFDLEIFKTKRELVSFVNQLKSNGYVEV
jgi:hypothetical protein